MTLWFEKKLGADWKLLVLVYGSMMIIIVSSACFIAIPKIKYANASVLERCVINLKKLHDEDKFCDTTNTILSHRVENESERRSLLTPKQKCQEDNKSFTAPDSGDSFIIFCHDDGTHDMKSLDELQSQNDPLISDYL